MRKNKRQQGSLEYLIIIAAVLAIAAIVVLFLTGAFGGASSSVDIAACKAAASRCDNERSTASTAICSYCEDICPIYYAEICKIGESSQITAVSDSVSEDLYRASLLGATIFGYTTDYDGTYSTAPKSINYKSRAFSVKLVSMYEMSDAWNYALSGGKDVEYLMSINAGTSEAYPIITVYDSDNSSVHEAYLSSEPTAEDKVIDSFVGQEPDLLSQLVNPDN